MLGTLPRQSMLCRVAAQPAGGLWWQHACITCLNLSTGPLLSCTVQASSCMAGGALAPWVHALRAVHAFLEPAAAVLYTAAACCQHAAGAYCVCLAQTQECQACCQLSCCAPYSRLIYSSAVCSRLLLGLLLLLLLLGPHLKAPQLRSSHPLCCTPSPMRVHRNMLTHLLHL
jgi:hypothetical protein